MLMALHTCPASSDRWHVAIFDSRKPTVRLDAKDKLRFDGAQSCCRYAEAPQILSAIGGQANHDDFTNQNPSFILASGSSR